MTKIDTFDHLPRLQGSTKQIAWATSIKSVALRQVDAFAETYRIERPEIYKEIMKRKELLEKQRNAEGWITQKKMFYPMSDIEAGERWVAWTDQATGKSIKYTKSYELKEGEGYTTVYLQLDEGTKIYAQLRKLTGDNDIMINQNFNKQTRVLKFEVPDSFIAKVSSTFPEQIQKIEI